MTLTQLRKMGQLQGLVISKDRHYFVISEDAPDDTFACRVSVTSKEAVEKEIIHYTETQRFRNTKVKRNIKTGEIIWRQY